MAELSDGWKLKWCVPRMMKPNHWNWSPGSASDASHQHRGRKKWNAQLRGDHGGTRQTQKPHYMKESRIQDFVVLECTITPDFLFYL